MYCRKAKLRFPLKSIVKEHKCGQSGPKTMLEDSEDPAVRSIQPKLGTGRKWKVDGSVKQEKEGLKIKEAIGLTQTGRKGLGSDGIKRLSKIENKEKSDLIIDEIKVIEDSKRMQKAVQQS
ncbi:reverse transcriptase [Plakobranchus ocellatus]|uniref:Reverse transcriptase n=1 Tax=Plakobranchus ocellatus TaxID=259542 RepID=A0AAV3Z6H3_9GAST|nr:reverse transcriptase [Plakobranchus ocellatus]